MSIEEALVKVKGLMNCSACMRRIEPFLRAFGEVRLEQGATERTPGHIMAAMAGAHAPRPSYDLA